MKNFSKTYKELSLQTRVCVEEREKILIVRLYFEKQYRKKHNLLVQELEHKVSVQERVIQV